MEMSSNYLLHCEVGSTMILRQLSIAQLNECTMTSFWSQQPYGMLMIVHVLTTRLYMYQGMLLSLQSAL
jgi:hypothetical protein